MREYLELELAELEQEDQIHKQLDLIQSMDELTKNDYPLFLTVKKLLTLIDATLENPFFCHNRKGNVI